MRELLLLSCWLARVWLNSGSADVTYAGNVVAGGMGLVCCVTPPGTGSGGLR